MRFVDPTDPSDPGVTVPSGAVAANRAFQMGSFTPGNYPAVVTFHQDRLLFAGCPNTPQRLDASVSSQYSTFSPSAVLDGTVTDSCAYGFALNSDAVDAIRWLESDSHGILVGTSGSEWLLNAGSLGNAITPTSIVAKQSTKYGSAIQASLRVGLETLFLQIGGRRLRALKYDFYTDGFIGPDISVLSEHLTVGGFVQYALQRTPQQIIWLVRADGTLVSISYDRDQDEQGWVLHQMGGDPATTKVLSVAVIPTPDASREEVWLAVQRTINGSVSVTVERMSKLWEIGDAVSYTVNGVTETKFVPANTTYLDCAARTVFGSPVTTVTGLTWLEGQTVSVLADSATHPDCVVTGGAITLQRSALDVNVGLNYTSRAQSMQIEAGGGDGPAQGKIKRIHRIIMRLFDTLGLQTTAGNAGAPVNDIPFRDSSDLMDAPPPLFTGDIQITWDGSYDRDGYVIWEQTQPLPSNVSAVIAQLETQDGG
jgi:hypothetical protein